MRNVLVDGLEVVERAVRKHPELRGPLMTWLRTVRDAKWHGIADVRRVYPSADGVRVRAGKTVVAGPDGVRRRREQLQAHHADRLLRPAAARHVGPDPRGIRQGTME